MKQDNERYLDAKYALQTSLTKLMEHKDWSELSITEVCREAGVNRSTFYAHYNNIYDLLKDTRETYHKVILKFHEGNGDSLLSYLKFIKDHKDAYKIYMFRFPEIKTNELSAEQDKMVSILQENIIKLGNYSDDEINYLSEFYIGGTLAVVKKWLRNDCIESPEFIKECIMKVFRGEH